MSVNVSAEVWAHSRAAGTALLVQLALADHADDQTRSCWPSLSFLAKKTRTSRDTVRRALRELEGLDEIEVPVRGGGHQSARYTVRTYQIATPSKLLPVAGCNLRGSTLATSEVAPVLPEPSLTTNEPSRPPAKASPAKATDDPLTARAHALTVLAFEQTPKPMATFVAAMGIIKGALEAGHHDDEARAAIMAGNVIWTRAAFEWAMMETRANGKVSYDPPGVVYR